MTKLLGGAVGHLAGYDLDLVDVQDLAVVELERRIAHAERPHLFAEAVVFQVALSQPRTTPSQRRSR